MLVIILTAGLVRAINRDFDNKTPVLHEAPVGFPKAEGLLREEYLHSKHHHHPRFLNTAQLMDPLESRHIDSISDNTVLMDEVNYLRSYVAEECRSIVCSPQGKSRFAECAESLLSVDRTCKVGCQDHLKMWVLKRCYMVETFDCGGNIGPNSVQTELTIFNAEGPQTLSQFTESINNIFVSKGVSCECCTFNDVFLTKDSAVSVTGGLVLALMAVFILG